MIPRITSVFASRLTSSLSFAFFSKTASSSVPSEFQRQKMSVKQLVDQTIADNKVAIFSKSTCPFCRRVKKLFADEFPDVETKVYELDNMEEGSAIQQYLLEKTGQRTVPNVFIGSKHIGGCDDTHASFKKGELAKLITA